MRLLRENLNPTVTVVSVRNDRTVERIALDASRPLLQSTGPDPGGACLAVLSLRRRDKSFLRSRYRQDRLREAQPICAIFGLNICHSLDVRKIVEDQSAHRNLRMSSMPVSWEMRQRRVLGMERQRE